MKYLEYFCIVIFAGFRKVFGLLWFWVAIPFDGYARNTVYNYVLQNRDTVWLKRLEERYPSKNPINGYYQLHGDRTEIGYIKYRKVCKAEFLFAYYVFYGWLDDDAVRSFTDDGFIKTILDGERKPLIKKYFGDRLQREYDYLQTTTFGNSFELGDLRQEYEIKVSKCWLSMLLWNFRNTAYNFKYMQYETLGVNKTFLWEIFGYRFGWIEKNVVKVEGKNNYHLVFFDKID